MNFLSVCSGIEAASVAWSPLGWRPVAFSEIERFPSAVLAHHYPHVPNLGDMTKFKSWPDYAIDLLCGGTPCQSFSIAGLRAGLADPRGDLMLTFGAIAARYRPRWLVWENVPGVLSSNGGRDFGAFLGLLGQLGYGFAYRVLDAQYFGVAQRRRRVFVVGSLGDWRSAAAVLFERHSLSGHPAPRREARQGIASTLAARAGSGSGLGIRAECDGGAGLITMAHGQGGAEIGFDQGPTLTCNHDAPIVAGTIAGGGRARGGYSHDDVPMVAHALRGEGFDASEDGTGRGTPLVPVAYDLRNVTSAENRSNPQPGAPCHTLHKPTDTVIAFDSRQEPVSSERVFGALGSSSPQAQAVAFTIAQNSNGLAWERDVTPTLDTTAGRNPHQQYGVRNGMQVRRLTPRECERLQGFPDDYTLIPLPLKSRQTRVRWAADGPRYKALGNSWAVPCAHWIGERIAAVEAIDLRSNP